MIATLITETPTSQTYHRICRVSRIRELEAQHTHLPLMERAGAAAAEIALKLIQHNKHNKHLPVLIVCGPGNNGGDGFVVARLLKQEGFILVVVFRGNPEQLPKDAAEAYKAWGTVGGRTECDIPSSETHDNYALVVDALFGIGLERPIDAALGALVAQINHFTCPILALDTPSGLNADTGQIVGSDVGGCAVRATHTATFIALKPGLLTLDGPDYCGETSVHDLGIDFAPNHANDKSPTPKTSNDSSQEGEIVTPALFVDCLKPRPKNSHKGMMGSVGIIGGAAGMVGAALLAGRAALKLGAGRVYLGLLTDQVAVDYNQPELMFQPPKELLKLGMLTALAIGPGLGESTSALNLLKLAIGSNLPLVLDADALNLVATHPVLTRQLAKRATPSILTPHPLEAARLLGVTLSVIQADRIAAALALAHKFNAAVVLKGVGSIIASPEGQWHINTSGNPGMASAGMGDVLTGMVVTLLAQGWSTHQAMLCAVHLHGTAADNLVESGVGPIGITAQEVIDIARQLFSYWATGNKLESK